MMLNATKRLYAAVWVWAPAALFFLLLEPTIATAAQRSRTIENIPPRPHLAPVGTSPDRLVAAITAAAEYLGWRVIGEAPGVVTAILMRRTHEAVVTIGYDELNFWIDYKDSKNLNYNPNRIAEQVPVGNHTVNRPVFRHDGHVANLSALDELPGLRDTRIRRERPDGR